MAGPASQPRFNGKLLQRTGTIAWLLGDFEHGYSSPIVVDLDGRPEVVVFTDAPIRSTCASRSKAPHTTAVESQPVSSANPRGQ